MMENDPVHLKDFVKRVRGIGGSRHAIFPLFYLDENGQYEGIILTATNKKIQAPWSAYLLALIQYSYKYLAKDGMRFKGTVFNPPGAGPSGFPEAGTLLRKVCAPRFPNSKYYFPTLSVIGQEYYAFGDDIYSPCYIAALQVGASLQDWDNEIPDIYPYRRRETF